MHKLKYLFWIASLFLFLLGLALIVFPQIGIIIGFVIILVGVFVFINGYPTYKAKKEKAH